MRKKFALPPFILSLGFSLSIRGMGTGSVLANAAAVCRTEERMDTARMTHEGERDPLAGTPYRTIAKLAAGGMGVVLDAEHRKLRKRVCVKILRDSSISAEFIDRMQLEAQSLAALDGHANVVLATDFGETPGGSPFLVMERLHGRTLLEERDARGGLPALEAIELACQVLAGLEAVHALGVVHRDIKPGNLFVCNARGDGRRIVKLLDFGAAKLVERDDAAPSVAPRALETAQGTVIGSPRYMAPEQIASSPSVDHRADLYAAGAVLFALLTGRGPFDDRKEHVAIVLAHLHDAPVAPSALAPHPVPEALDRAVLRALAKKPGDRYQDARSFAAELLGIARRLRAGVETMAPVAAAQEPEAQDGATIASDDDPTMISTPFGANDGSTRARRPMLWVSLGGIVAGVLLGLSLFGVLR